MRYHCVRCGKSYTMKCNLRRHQRVECGKAKTNICFICKKSYYYRQELNIHMSQNNASYVTNAESLTDIEEVCIHTKSMNVENHRSFLAPTCNNCGKYYKYRGSLSTHQKYECGKIPQFACMYCSHVAKQKGNLKLHMKNKHKHFQCFSCGKYYKYKRNLYSHQKYECGKTPQFPCGYCSYIAKLKGHLIRHIRSPYVCSTCMKWYQHKRSLARHTKLECNKEPNFHCTHEGCDYKSFQKANYVRHLIIRHKKFACDRCQKKYISKGCLAVHRSVYCGKKPKLLCHLCPYKTYLCDSCPRMYTRKSGLTQHQRYECGRDPQYNCPQKGCKYKSKRKWTITQHLKKNPERYAEYKKKQLERYHASKKLVKDMTKNEHLSAKKKWRQARRKRKAKKKIILSLKQEGN
nr:unnamed protein product [Callosobruchus analis]